MTSIGRGGPRCLGAFRLNGLLDKVSVEGRRFDFLESDEEEQEHGCSHVSIPELTWRESWKRSFNLIDFSSR